MLLSFPTTQKGGKKWSERGWLQASTTKASTNMWLMGNVVGCDSGVRFIQTDSLIWPTTNTQAGNPLSSLAKIKGKQVTS